jgi:glutathione synthase/RimK-type ligase-like ATP-grasp enzyme
VRARIATTDLSFPLILKPDVGERGEGVVRVDDEQRLFDVLAIARRPMLLQQLVAWPHEYGLMFAKDPRTDRTMHCSP